ncbi:hypothetical protein RJT34_19893 [Clitoria ternatea]|uniref:Mediator of RNA polymerase II transcription subunit 14 n=1 Tax=Clitoria ternatea TaxID=43366 RepID=A0AAN9ISB3_CLITE
MVAESGVELSTLVKRAAQDSYTSLQELINKCMFSQLPDADKKLSILKFLNNTQQCMIRLIVLSQWGLQLARAPIYDVPSAIDVLLTGNYRRLQKCIEDVGARHALNGAQQKHALKKLDMLVRSKLLEVYIPYEFSGVEVSDGIAMLRVDGEFKVLVTLGYRGHLSLWRILHLELLVGEKNKPVKLGERRRNILGDDMERRMAVAENPFSVLYSVLHGICVALVMDTVVRQVQTLGHGRWKDAIRFELISEGGVGHGVSSSSVQNLGGEYDSSVLQILGLKIVYWLDFVTNAAMSESGSCPFIIVEPGSDLKIKCLHSNSVIDPLTSKEAEFFLEQSCIDVERFLLRAICCNGYTRLLEIKSQLVKNGQVCRTADDVVLQSPTGDLDIEYKQVGLCLLGKNFSCKFGVLNWYAVLGFP